MANQEPTCSAASHETAAIAVSLRLPQFWRQRPRQWFIAFEAATNDLKSSDAQLAQMIIAKLDQEDIDQIMDLIEKPVGKSQYENIKQRLISLYEESEGKQLQRLLDMELGDQKPTQLLRNMRNLGRNKIPDNTLQMMWMKLLPQHVRSILIVSDTLSKDATLEELAKLADKMLEQDDQISSIIASKKPEEPDQQPLLQEIEKLKLEITELKSSRYGQVPQQRFTNHRQNSSLRPSTSRSYSRNLRTASPTTYCFFHRRFGKDARRCTAPCSFHQNQSPRSNVCYFHRRFRKHAQKCSRPCKYAKEIEPQEIRSELAATDSIGSNRLFIVDRNSKQKFLIDTGANISVIPKNGRMKCEPTNFCLYAANNTMITTYGEKTLELNFNLQRSYRWKFIIAAVSKPIIGADFLRHHKLLVDIAGRCIIDKLTGVSIRTSVSSSAEPTIRTIDTEQKYHQILEDFPDITRPSPMKFYNNNEVKHYIETNGPPLHAKARPIPPHRQVIVKKEFEHMIEQGLCRPSKSPWASPLHIVPKKNGDIRVCGDYRRLNAVTKPDRYPVPRLKDFTYQLHGMNIFSTLDLNRAYQQIPVLQQHIEKTAIITPFGLFEFPKMCPGLKNAGQTFQRYIHEVLTGLDNVFSFIDDLIIASRDEETHVRDVRTVLERLDHHGITINPSKCKFDQEEVKFLGYKVSRQGIKPLEEKMELIANFPKPATIEELRRFLGMINFYRDSIPNAAAIQAPLNEYLHNSKKKDKTAIDWTIAASHAFEACKSSIESATMLAHPAHHASIALMCDASDKCVGAVLQQKLNGKWQALGYFSKKLSDAQQKYSTFDRELLSIYMAVKHFRKIFEGRELIIFTDHKPLTYAINKSPSDSDTARRIRQLLFISEFTTDIRHVKGPENVVADALSRVETIDVPSYLDYQRLSLSQENDEDIHLLQQQSNIQLKKFSVPGSDLEIYCETSTSYVRPYLTKEFRRTAFDAVHNSSHPGIRSTRKLIQRRFFWPSVNVDVGNWAKTCVPCQQSKVQRHTQSDFASFSDCDRFQHVHIDVVGPLPTTSHGHRYLLTMIDRKTRWPEAIPLHEITAEIVAAAFYENWVCRFGCPATITTDQGRQFESQLFHALAKLLGAEKNRTTAYHPQTNGIVERWHRSLKAALMARLETSIKWTAELPTVLLGLRAATRMDTNTSAAQLTYGQAIRLPGEFIMPERSTSTMDSSFVDQLHQTIKSLSPVYSPHSSKRNIFIHEDLHTCEAVFLRVDCVKKPLQQPYEGPYQVLQRNNKFFKIRLPNRDVNVSIDRLKPAYKLIDDLSANIANTCHPTAEKFEPPTTTRSGRIIKKPVRFA